VYWLWRIFCETYYELRLDTTIEQTSTCETLDQGGCGCSGDNRHPDRCSLFGVDRHLSACTIPGHRLLLLGRFNTVSVRCRAGTGSAHSGMLHYKLFFSQIVWFVWMAGTMNRRGLGLLFSEINCLPKVFFCFSGLPLI